MAINFMFLLAVVIVLPLISLSIFFIIFGLVKRMNGFVIAGVAILLLFVICIVMLCLLNFGVNI